MGDPTDPGASAPADPDPLAGLTGVRFLSLERAPIRTRESPAALSAWRLAVSTDQGEGAILSVEVSSGRSLCRGDGVFLGWPQERLEPAYRALLPPAQEPAFELNQLG